MSSLLNPVLTADRFVMIPIVFGSGPPDAAADGLLYVFDAAKSNSENTFKNGAAYPNVVVGDAFRYQNLRWEWQFHFGSASLAGLTAVASDTSLTGTGTVTDPLSVANPFPASAATKLNGIESGAEVNPLNLVKFSAGSGDTQDAIADSQIGFYLQTSLVQSGSITQADRIDIADGNAAFGSDTSSPSTDLDAVNTTRFFQDKLENGGSFKVLLNKRGTTNHIWVQADVISAKAGGWSLTGLTWFGDTTISGVNDIWNLIAGTDAVFTQDIVNLAVTLNQYVSKSDVQPKESDFISNFSNDLLETGVTDKRYGISVASTGTGAPTNDNLYGKLNQVANGSRTLIVSKTQWKNTDFESTKTLTADNFEIGTAIYLNFDGVNGWHKTFTPTAAPVSVGSGNGSYFYVFGTVATNGTPASQSDNTIAVRDREPSTFWDNTEIPASAIVGENWIQRPDDSAPTITTTSDVLLRDASGLWKATTLAHFNEHMTPITTGPQYLPVTWESSPNSLTSTDYNKIGIQNALQNQNGIMQLVWVIPDDVPLKGGGTLPLADVKTRFNQHHQMEVYSGSSVIKGQITSFSVAFGKHYINLQNATQTGTFSDGAAFEVQLQSNLVARDEFSDTAFTGKADLKGGIQESFDSSSWTAYSALTFEANMLLFLSVATSATGFAAVSSIRFGDIPTTGVQITTNFDVRRNGQSLQFQRTGGTDTLYVRVQVVDTNIS